MFRLIYALPAAALVLAPVAFAPHALAFAQAQGDSQVKVPSFTRRQERATKLSPIVVQGQRLPFPVELQYIKKALTRAYSGNPKDRNKLVCRWQTRLGQHFQYLQCETNAAHAGNARETEIAWTNAASMYPQVSRHPKEPFAGPKAINRSMFQGLINGYVGMQVSNMTTRNRIRRGTLGPLLSKMPPVDSSYTVRVTGDNGKPLIEYVFEKGELAHIYHFVYKNGNAVKY